ncbi:MAG TPA: DUF190 domain-containing protein [Vicinamibacterales bacterium]|jgi:hypothetical protein|nr:DUF190 domain-containing protein [Vicinamibacterales bacterium]
MKQPIKLLLILVNESDLWREEQTLYVAVVRRLHELGIAGATAQPGLMGYSHHKHAHHKRLFGISDDRPVTITAIDTEAKLREALPHIREIVTEGLLLLLDAELIADVTCVS